MVQEEFSSPLTMVAPGETHLLLLIFGGEVSHPAAQVSIWLQCQMKGVSTPPLTTAATGHGRLLLMSCGKTSPPTARGSSWLQWCAEVEFTRLLIMAAAGH